MRKIIIGMHAGMAGTDGWEFWEVPDNISEAELDEFAWECGLYHAESYGIYYRPVYVEDSELSEDELYSDCYSDNIEGWWEPYSPEKHDGYRVGGDTSWNQY